MSGSTVLTSFSEQWGNHGLVCWKHPNCETRTELHEYGCLGIWSTQPCKSFPCYFEGYVLRLRWRCIYLFIFTLLNFLTEVWFELKEIELTEVRRTGKLKGRLIRLACFGSRVNCICESARSFESSIHLLFITSIWWAYLGDGEPITVSKWCWSFPKSQDSAFRSLALLRWYFSS